ncbi:MAG: 50S ribosomal protein L6 [Bacilli bacterium]|nr:50S ribosomal protein L6 [Bacilli bacterium]
MSRIGNRSLTIPTGVTVEVNDNVVTVKGPKGELSLNLVNGLNVKVEEGSLKVEKTEDNKELEAMYGTTNALINNMITGVSKGYEKSLEIVGVGYRFQLRGNTLVVSSGKSHTDEITVPSGLTVEVVSNNEITIKGISKELVGEFAAKVRKVRKPEPYKGKGIRYKDEFIRRKEGKKASK